MAVFLPGEVDVKGNLREIAQEYLTGTDGKRLDLADFQVELLQLMFQGGKYVVNWPTDHMKSFVSAFLFPILSLIDEPNGNHLICGANIADSKSRIYALQLELATNLNLTQAFPWLKKPERTKDGVWTRTHFNIAGRHSSGDRNYSVLAVSTTSQDVRGRRGKLILDDIEGTEARNSPTERDKLLRWVREEAWRCYEDEGDTPRPLLMALGTPFDPDSIYFALENQGFTARRFSCYVSEWTTNSEGKPWYHPTYTWPRKARKIEEARKEMEKEQFAISYRMDPSGGDPDRLSFKQLLELAKKGIDPATESAKPFTIVCLDPASGSTGRRADYAGLSVSRVSWPNNQGHPAVEVLECLKFTGGLYEQVLRCAEWAYSYDCPIVYETNSQQGNTYREAFQNAHPQLVTQGKLVGHFTTAQMKTDYNLGLSVVRTLLKETRLRLGPQAIDSEGGRVFLQEIADLGRSGRHDHITASVWFGIWYVYQRRKLFQGKLQSAFRPGWRGSASPFFSGRPMVGTFRRTVWPSSN